MEVRKDVGRPTPSTRRSSTPRSRPVSRSTRTTTASPSSGSPSCSTSSRTGRATTPRARTSARSSTIRTSRSSPSRLPASCSSSAIAASASSTSARAAWSAPTRRPRSSCPAVRSSSPGLLLSSGIGPAAELRALGIDVVADLPGVGRNLHDHLLSPMHLRVQGRSRRRRTASPTCRPTCSRRAIRVCSVPDLQPLTFAIPMYEPWMEPLSPTGFTLMAGMVRPAEPRDDQARRPRIRPTAC